MPEAAPGVRATWSLEGRDLRGSKARAQGRGEDRQHASPGLEMEGEGVCNQKMSDTST